METGVAARLKKETRVMGQTSPGDRIHRLFLTAGSPFGPAGSTLPARYGTLGRFAAARVTPIRPSSGATVRYSAWLFAPLMKTTFTELRACRTALGNSSRASHLFPQQNPL